MKNRIFRQKQEEYWDIWCEEAIVFPESMSLEDAFTEENMRKLIRSYSDPKKYPTYKITIAQSNTVDVVIYAEGEDEDEDAFTEEISFEFVEMSDVLVIKQHYIQRLVYEMWSKEEFFIYRVMLF